MSSSLIETPDLSVSPPPSGRSLTSRLLEGALLPAGDVLFRQDMMRALRAVREAQWRDPRALAAAADERVRELISVAYHETAFYRELMDARGLKPADIRATADLRKLPPVSKAMLREAYPDRASRSSRGRRFVVRTSGSTGANFELLTDSIAVGRARALLMLAFEWAGWRIGDAHLQNGINPGRSLDRKLKDRLLRCFYVPAFDLSDSVFERCLRIFEDRGVRFAFGYPSGFYYLALYARERGWNRPLERIVTWGDNLHPHYRETIETVFGARILDTYGCSEEIQVAAQCGRCDGYHVFSTDVVAEFLDEDLQPASAGRMGEIVLTRLYPGPMPLIRYRVGDLGVDAADAARPCGRGFPLMRSIQGRITDVVLTPRGNRLIVHFFTGILEYFHEVRAYQVVQREVASITVNIVPGPGFSSETAAAIARRIRELGDPDLDVRVETVTEIRPSPSGKRRFVISDCGGFGGPAEVAR